ncbi:MAG: GxxExxY protein [bacterium]
MEKAALTEKIIGCALRVHQSLWPGYLESVYQNALLIELKKADIEAVKNHRIPVYYEGEQVGDFVADVIVDSSVILELKATQEIHPAHEAQLVNYLQSTGLEIGLILNFGAASLQVKRKHKSSPLGNPENPVHPVKKAFSLLEILVAISVLSILLVVLLNIVHGSTTLWRTAENRAEAYREARAAVQVVSADLRNLLPSTNSAYFLTNLPGSDASTRPNSQIGFLTTLPATTQNTNNKSDLCAVAYFLAYGNKGPLAGSHGRQSYNLYRYFIESNETFANLLKNAPFSGVTPTNTNCEILSRNILDFQVTPLMTSTNGFTNWTYSSSTPTPDLVELKIVGLNNERSQRFNARSDQAGWDTLRGETNTSDYLKNTKTFTTRVKINHP